MTARRELIRFQEAVEPLLGDADESPSIRNWLGKLAGAVVRISGILCIADQGMEPSSKWKLEVQADHVRRAIRMGDFFTPHARAVLGLMGAHPAIEKARRILEWIQRTRFPSFTVRQIHAALKTTFKRVKEIRDPLNVLEERGYIREIPAKPRSGPGRPASPRFEVHPDLLAQKPHNPQNLGTADDPEGFVDSVEFEKGGRDADKGEGEDIVEVEL